MAATIWKLVNLNTKLNPSLGGSVRYGHHLRGKPPGVARSLEQRLEELNFKDPEIHYKVNIGFAKKQLKRNAVLSERITILKDNHRNQDLEKKARTNKLEIDLDNVRKEWLKTAGPEHIKRIANHYGIFDDLYGDAYFHPTVPLHINYEIGDGQLPIYYGNVVKPSDAKVKPKISFESDENTFWTLIMTNPDGHLTMENKEYVHWFVGNIPGNKVESGETIVDYMQPIPPKGSGYHRHIFVLYKQEKKLDFEQLKKSGPCLTLSERTFSTLDFYRERQDDLTPAGLVFFQSDWDATLTDFYHDVLNMKEPRYEYDFPETYVKPQEWFPLRQAFNLYMDRYRDPKQINKEFLKRKLQKVHPFKAPEKPVPYPNAVPWNGYVPSWLKLEKTKSMNKWGRVNDIE
ncbi:PREDICTED: 39S ribosomal protein L38, mitochondrial [Nicrophorus vespilloides]|uniref:Large ribosomal subunit protein mL38 n=1 Tax=Nicrophorus vespilloides TaxID=110193 RepID=A0ABM1MXB2_NICVS|nr:PREDICTED: 39S ribosomal protein L38, mitochondrial [Nicrophorus vespilloides]XP_017779212.1 PREDICTED: 39S ribosomal protein L38, mitochondrial [Nicrophorus vespilloides]